MAVISLSEGIEFILLCEYHGVVVSAGYLGHFFLLEKLDELWFRQVFFVGVAQLSLVLVLAAASPAVDLSRCVEGQAVEVSAGDIENGLVAEVLGVEPVDALALASGLVPEAAAPREERALLGERQRVVVPAGHLPDPVLQHRLVQVELSEVADLRRDADLPEEQRPAHVYLALVVVDGGVGAGGGDAHGSPSESLDGRGQVSSFVIGYCQFAILVAAPGVDEDCASAFD